MHKSITMSISEVSILVRGRWMKLTGHPKKEWRVAQCAQFNLQESMTPTYWLESLAQAVCTAASSPCRTPLCCFGPCTFIIMYRKRRPDFKIALPPLPGPWDGYCQCHPNHRIIMCVYLRQCSVHRLFLLFGLCPPPPPQVKLNNIYFCQTSNRSTSSSTPPPNLALQIPPFRSLFRKCRQFKLYDRPKTIYIRVWESKF